MSENNMSVCFCSSFRMILDGSVVCSRTLVNIFHFSIIIQSWSISHHPS